MIGIIDYNAGNLRSVTNALDRLARPYRICSEPADLAQVRIVVLPGVGQFASALRSLRASGLFDALYAWGKEDKPIVGICLGLQLLFDASEEAPGESGLALLPGRIIRLRAAIVPHMGWNRVELLSEMDWLSQSDGQYFYFAHGFIAVPKNARDVVAAAEVGGISVPAVITHGAIRAVQFHPEKSATAGAHLLERMLRC